jgi:MoaA/NifB/PqqE/SkfB family radical SAM enzyme
MTLEEVKGVFSSPTFNDLEEIILTGGEIFLREDLVDIVLFIHKVLPKVKFSISTNGLLVNRVEKLVRVCLVSGIPFDIGVSMDGIGMCHDYIRGVDGNFAKVDDLIRRLINLREVFGKHFVIVIGQTLHPLTVDHVRSVKEYADKHGVAYLLQMYDEAPYYSNQSMKATANEIKRMIKTVNDLPPSFQTELLKEILKHGKVKFECFALRSFCVLRANGDIVSCLRMIDRKKIKECKGCANTWCSGWSMQENFVPFIPLLRRAMWRRIIRR